MLNAGEFCEGSCSETNCSLSYSLCSTGANPNSLQKALTWIGSSVCSSNSPHKMRTTKRTKKLEKRPNMMKRLQLLSSRKVSHPATRALEQALAQEQRSIAAASRAGNKEGTPSRKKCSFVDLSVMFQAASSAVEVQDFPPIEWCHDEDDLDYGYWGELEAMFVSSKRRKHSHPDADAGRRTEPAMLRSKAFPSNLSRLSEGQQFSVADQSPSPTINAHSTPTSNLLTTKISTIDHPQISGRNHFEPRPLKNRHSSIIHPSSSLSVPSLIRGEQAEMNE